MVSSTKHNPSSSLSVTGSLLTEMSDIIADVDLSDVSPALGDISVKRDIFAEQSRRAWDTSVEARCNFDWHPRMVHRGTVWFLSLWQKSVMGRTLKEIKSDPEEIHHFSSAMADFLLDFFCGSPSPQSWAICTTPKRRHKEHNFASLISAEIAVRLGIPFVEDVALCRNRGRINAEFILNRLPDAPNIIVFDDFVTTGSTLKAMRQLLSPLNKSLLFVAGINNAL